MTWLRDWVTNRRNSLSCYSQLRMLLKSNMSRNSPAVWQRRCPARWSRRSWSSSGQPPTSWSLTSRTRRCTGPGCDPWGRARGPSSPARPILFVSACCRPGSADGRANIRCGVSYKASGIMSKIPPAPNQRIKEIDCGQSKKHSMLFLIWLLIFIFLILYIILYLYKSFLVNFHSPD